MAEGLYRIGGTVLCFSANLIMLLAICLFIKFLKIFFFLPIQNAFTWKYSHHLCLTRFVKSRSLGRLDLSNTVITVMRNHLNVSYFRILKAVLK